MLHVFEERVFPFLTAHNSHCEHLNELLEPWAKLRCSIFNLFNLSSQNQWFSDFFNRDKGKYGVRYTLKLFIAPNVALYCTNTTS